MKRRFRILLLSPEYKIDVQARIPAALCAIHNFIRTHDGQEGLLPERRDIFDNDNPEYQGQPADVAAQPEVINNANILRDRIAQKMWDDYQLILAERGALDDFSIVDIDDDYINDNDDNEL